MLLFFVYGGANQLKDFDCNEKTGYIFISYSHLDREIIQPFLETLYKDGFNFWYDKNLSWASHWSEDLASKIEKSETFFAFATENYFNSVICKEELLYTVRRYPQKKVFLISGSDLLLPDISRLSITDINSFRSVIVKSDDLNGSRIISDKLNIKKKEPQNSPQMQRRTCDRDAKLKQENNKQISFVDKKNVFPIWVTIALLCVITVAITVTAIVVHNKENAKTVTEFAQGETIVGDNFSKEDIDSCFVELSQEILENPIMGDMLVQGLLQLKISDQKTMEDEVPWLNEFVDKTTQAMNLPVDTHPRGMEIWLESYTGTDSGTGLYVSQEYVEYAVRLVMALDSLDRTEGKISGIRWAHNNATLASDTRTYMKGRVEDQDALIFQVKTSDGKVIRLFGFLLADKSLVIPEENIKIDDE